MVSTEQWELVDIASSMSCDFTELRLCFKGPRIGHLFLILSYLLFPVFMNRRSREINWTHTPNATQPPRHVESGLQTGIRVISTKPRCLMYNYPPPHSTDCSEDRKTTLRERLIFKEKVFRSRSRSCGNSRQMERNSYQCKIKEQNTFRTNGCLVPFGLRGKNND